MIKDLRWSEISQFPTDVLIEKTNKKTIDSIYKIADEIASDRRIKLIFVTGPSASGKTTFSTLLEKRLDTLGHEAHMLSMDNFFINREDLPFLDEKNDIRDYDSINAVDLELLNKCFKEILEEYESQIPVFDFLTGKRSDKTRHLKMTKNDVVIIEGIHSFNPLIQDNLDKNSIRNIYIEPTVNIHFDNGEILTHKDIRLIRRSIRDKFTRGYDFKATLAQWKYVLESEIKHIYPYVSNANFTVNSFADYELMVYKDLMKVEDINVVYQHINKIFDIIEPLSPSKVPEHSIVREFTKF